MAFKLGRVSRLMVSPTRHPKTGVFYFRQTVPEPLRAAVGAALGKPSGSLRELKWSLGTKDAREAKRLMPEALRKAADILEAARGRARPLSQRDQHALGGLFYRDLMARWDQDPTDAEGWAQAVEVWERGAGPANLLPEFMVQDFLASQSVICPPDCLSRLHTLLASRLTQALVQFQRQQSGDYRPDPALERFLLISAEI